MGIFVGIVLLVMAFNNKQDIPEDIHTPIDGNYLFSEVYDINEYQTVYNCSKAYYNAINSSVNEVFSLLYEDYTVKNNITFNNIESYVEKKYANFNYVIHALEKYSNVYYSLYFVEATYSLEGLDSIVEETKVKDVIIEDVANGTFAVLPVLNIDTTFKDIIEEYQLVQYNTVIVKNGNNEIKNGVISEFNEAIMYFNDFISIVNNNCSQAYSLLSEDTQKNYSSIYDFQKVCDQYKTKYVSPVIANYRIDVDGIKRSIKIKDNYSIDYTFIINSVKNYKVDVTLK